jgi:hypothetical protein
LPTSRTPTQPFRLELSEIRFCAASLTEDAQDFGFRSFGDADEICKDFRFEPAKTFRNISRGRRRRVVKLLSPAKAVADSRTREKLVAKQPQFLGTLPGGEIAEITQTSHLDVECNPPANHALPVISRCSARA